MQKTTTTQKSLRNSRFSKTLKKFVFKPKISDFNFLRENQGSVTTQKLNTGSYKVTFNSRVTHKEAFAYGKTFRTAYENMITNFHLKY